jgi:hypothetical protein
MAEASALVDHEDEVIGWVWGVPVRSAQLAPYVRRLSAEPAGQRLGITDDAYAVAAQSPSTVAGLRTWAIKSLLVDTLLEVEAARLGVSDPTSPTQWADRLEAAAQVTILPPTEDEVEAYYRANPGRFVVTEARRARHLLVADCETAEQLRAHVTQGSEAQSTDLSAMAEATSRDRASARQGGELGWVERGQLAGPLEDAIFAAEPGQVVGPVLSTFGWHVLVVDEVRSASLRSLDACRAELEAELVSARRRQALLAWTDQRLAEAVRVPEGAEHPNWRGLPGSHHRH